MGNFDYDGSGYLRKCDTTKINDSTAETTPFSDWPGNEATISNDLSLQSGYTI